MAVPCNIGRKEELQQLVAAVEERWGKVDILVCNAAINPWIGSTLDVEDATFRKVMETNLMGAHWLCQLVLPGILNGETAALFWSRHYPGRQEAASSVSTDYPRLRVIRWRGIWR